MQAWIARQGGPLDVLHLESSLPIPNPHNANHVLIQVAYSDVNPVDLQKVAATRSELVPGYSGSGIIVVNDNDDDIVASQTRVCFLADPTNPWGCFAEYCAVPRECICPVPDSVSLQSAATVPLAGLTAYEALFKVGLGPPTLPSSNGSLLSTRRLLIVGGAGGVGSWATLLAKAWHGDSIEIVATASSKESQHWCRRQGATHVIPHDDIVATLGGGGPEGSVDAILCLTEPVPKLWKSLTEVIRPYGSICLVVAGESIQSLDLSFCFFKCVNVVTETVFSSSRTQFRYIRPCDEMSAILQLLQDQRIQAPLAPDFVGTDDVPDWKAAKDPNGVFERIASRHTQGKLVMKIMGDTVGL